MKETLQIPTDRCDECGQTKAALGFVSLGSDARTRAAQGAHALWSAGRMRRRREE